MSRCCFGALGRGLKDEGWAAYQEPLLGARSRRKIVDSKKLTPLAYRKVISAIVGNLRALPVTKFNLAIRAGPQAVRSVWMTKFRLGHRQTARRDVDFKLFATSLFFWVTPTENV